MKTRTCGYCGAPFTHRSNAVKYCEQHRAISSYGDIAGSARRRAMKLGLTSHYTGAELFELVRKYGSACMRCGTTERGFMAHVPDHIIPLSLGGSNTIDNIQILCFGCNGKKRNYTIDYRQFAKPLDKSA